MPEQATTEPTKRNVGWFQHLDNTVRAVANGATFGYGDKIAGWANSWFNGKSANQSIKEEEARSAQAKIDTPIASMVGEVAGQLATIEIAAVRLLKIESISSIALPKWALKGTTKLAAGLGLSTAAAVGAAVTHTGDDENHAAPIATKATPAAAIRTEKHEPSATAMAIAHDPLLARLVQKAMLKTGILEAGALGNTGKHHDGVDADWRTKSQAGLEKICLAIHVDPSKVDITKPPNSETQKVLDYLHIKLANHTQQPDGVGTTGQRTPGTQVSSPIVQR